MQVPERRCKCTQDNNDRLTTVIRLNPEIDDTSEDIEDDHEIGTVERISLCSRA